ncbi:MAG TPA: ABC transporter permease [Dehalococcoidia bacterium]|nr:ABC transporter permease [Dehalococcoidia bacterium]
MSNYIARRILWLIPVMFFISLVTFVLMHNVEGGPWDSERKLPDHVIENLNRKYGLDKPLWRQYVDFVANALQGDLGISFQRQDKPVTDILLGGLKVTGMLGLMALGMASVVGISLGIMAALNKNGPIDYLSVLLATIGSSIPSFVLGIFLIYFLSVEWHILPTYGWNLRNGFIPGWVPPLKQAVMPVICLAALPTAFLARVTRASMLEVLRQDYVRTARAKGLPSLTVLYRHSFRNALIPILTILGPIAVNLVTGAFIVEQLFSIPGNGRLFIQSINGRDYGLIMGTTLFYAFFIAIANLAVDITYALVDPRIRYR